MMQAVAEEMMSKLALLGGQPIFEQPIGWHWPPVDAVTAQKLIDLYYSKHWTAWDDEAEPTFARSFAEYQGARYGVFTINGTITLQCALGAYGIGPGDEVIVPPLTFYATAIAVRQVGARPVFVDVEPETLCIDPEKITTAINERTKAIIPVHAYGSMADMDRIMAIAKRNSIKVIEDAAHMHGGIWDGKGIGSIGDVGSFSFQHWKTMSSGEGGICITNDRDIAERIYRMTHVGCSYGDLVRHAKSGPPPGLLCSNYRALAFQAVILQEQLKALDTLLERYHRTVVYLEGRLKQSTKIRFQKPGRKAERQGHYAWVMLFDDPSYAGISVEVIRAALEAEGVRVLHPEGPMYRHVLFNLECPAYRIDQPCLVTEHTRQCALLLMHPYLGLDQVQIEKIADSIEKVMSNAEALRIYGNRSGAPAMVG